MTIRDNAGRTRRAARFASLMGLAMLLLLGLACEEKKESGTADEFLKKEQAKRAEQKKAKAKTTTAKTSTPAPDSQEPTTATGSGKQDVVATTEPLSASTPVMTSEPGPTASAMPEVKLTEQFIKQGKYEEAITKAKEALRKNEKHTPAMVAMAHAYYYLNKHEFAESICDLALSLDAKIGQCYNLKGFIALKVENDAQALEHFKKATEVEPSFGPPFLNLGALYLKAKNFKAAIPVLEAAVQLMPAKAEVHLNLGSAYRGEGEAIKAQASFMKALSIRSTYPAAYYNLGVLFLDAEQFPGMDVLTRLNKAVEYFNTYKKQVVQLPKDDLADAFIDEAQKKYDREKKRLEKEAQKESRRKAKEAEDAKKAETASPPAAPAAPTGTAPGAGTSGSGTSAPPPSGTGAPSTAPAPAPTKP